MNYTIRLFRREDVGKIVAFERENANWFEDWVPPRAASYHSVETLLPILDERLSAQSRYECLFFLILDGATVIGHVYLTDINDGHAAIGYRIAKQKTGQGVMTWALGAVIARPECASLSKFTAFVSPTNIASCRVVEKLGFSQIDGAEKWVTHAGADLCLQKYELEVQR